MIERAKGILQQRTGLSEEDAYLTLKNQSRKLHRPMKELAEAFILSEDLHRHGGFGTKPIRGFGATER